MSHPVEITTIGAIFEHDNADRLEIVQPGNTDWRVIVGKGQFNVGDVCVYVPIDSILERKLEDHLFPPDSKITLDKSRVRSIRIRGSVSQGMIIDIDNELIDMYPKLNINRSKVGDDVGEILGITKYEPPVKSQGAGGASNVKRKNNPAFLKYTDIENLKFYPDLFEASELVYITEKIHGTSARYGMLPTHVTGWLKRLKKLFHLLPEFEYCYGSRNVQLQDTKKKTFYGKDVYGKVGKELNLEKVLHANEQLFGEIVGQGIQKGYSYGQAPGEYKLFAYDVKIDGEYLGSVAFKNWCNERNIDRVPQVYVGLYGGANIDELKSGGSLIWKLVDGYFSTTQEVREGAVVKPMVEDKTSKIGRKVLKAISDEYLLSPENTDFH